jgi:hypothetical protein
MDATTGRSEQPSFVLGGGRTTCHLGDPHSPVAPSCLSCIALDVQSIFATHNNIRGLIRAAPTSIIEPPYICFLAADQQLSGAAIGSIIISRAISAADVVRETPPPYAMM